MTLLLLPSPSSTLLLPLRLQSPLFFPHPPRRPRTAATFYYPRPRRLPLNPALSSAARRSPPAALAWSDQDLLQALVGPDDDGAKSHLPAVRFYENDLARLSVIGDVPFSQALTAAAADGGDTAEEHLSSGLPTMAVQTVYPGGFDEHSTVSTRLFLPARKVKEKAKNLRSGLTDDILSSTMSRNILAMTFRLVVLQHLWSLELTLFCPGTERDMTDLASTREIPVHFTINSSDDRVVSMLSEAVCSCALESAERDYLHNAGGTSPNGILGWFQKPRRSVSSDSSVCIFRISSNEIVNNARKQMAKFMSVKGRPSHRERKVKHRWWTPPTYSSLEKIGGLGFSVWTNEHIPAYRLQINGEKFISVKFGGWQRSANNRWEVLLTHFQMVELANILDMYYEDQYTIPDKQLSCGLITRFPSGSRNKRSSLWKTVAVTLAGGCVLVSFGILAQLHWPHLFKARNSSTLHTLVPVYEDDYSQPQSLEATEDSNDYNGRLEALCISVVRKIKDELGWPGDITVDRNAGAWTGQLPSCLRNVDGTDLVQEVDSSSGDVAPASSDGDIPILADMSTGTTPPAGLNLDMPMNAQDIASYQVVLSRDGQIVGFQPTSHVAINHWATNPLAKSLYKGRKLSPGILEPSLKIPRPHDIVPIELLMSVNPNMWFVLARPIR